MTNAPRATQIEDTIDKLRSEHSSVKQRLAQLQGNRSWTSQEQAERARLKKQKLWLKDRISALLHAEQEPKPRDN